MEFVSDNFSPKNVNFKGKNLNKNIKNDKKPKEAEAKKVGAKALDVLASYNQASINFRGNSKEDYDQIFQKLSDWFEDTNASKQLKYYIPKINEDNIALTEKVCFEKVEKGQDLFYGKNKIDYRNITKDNFALAKLLYFGKDEDGHDLFPKKGEITHILRYTTKDNIALAEILCIGRDEDGHDLFRKKDKIGNILERTTKDNIALAEILCIGRDENGHDLFPAKGEITYIIRHITKDNIALAEKLCLGKDEDGNDLFPEKYKISHILHYTTKDNITLAEKLCLGKDEDGNDLFSDKDNIGNILCYTTKDNIELAEQLLFGKDEDSHDLFPDKSKINHILHYTTKDNITLAEQLLFGKDEYGHDLFPNKNKIGDILRYTTKDNITLAEILCIGRDEDSHDLFPEKEIIPSILKSHAPREKIEKVIRLCQSGELSYNCIPLIFQDDMEFDYRKYRILKHTFGKEEIAKLPTQELALACKIAHLAKKDNINEIDVAHKKDVLRNIISKNTELFSCNDKLKEMFPLIPKNQEEYCELVSELAKSIGIETNEISQEENETFNISLKNLSTSLASMSDMEFNSLEFHQEYPKEDFIRDVFNLVKDMNPQERQKVYDYFGFELKPNKNGLKISDDVYTSLSIIGYPVNLNNGKKLAQIENIETKQIIEQMRPKVIRFSENNHVTCSNKELEESINKILTICPEIRTEIGRIQHGAHEFDVFKHSLKVMQKIVQNPQFRKLNDSDKKIMLIASLFHDITKAEGRKDKVHAIESAFDGYYISKKFDLTHEEEIKLYSLIRNHEWLGYINSDSEESQEKREEKIKSVAYDLQYDNLFEMSKIFTEADLKAIKKDDGFFDKYNDVFAKKSQNVESYINELKITQPLLPVTKIPSSSRIKQAITRVNSDSSTNLKGIYQDENGMIIIRYNEVENETWEKIGFSKDSVSKGIKTTSSSNKKVNTGNIKFFAHGLEEKWELRNFDAFQLPDSDALLSVSYMELPESKYRLFRNCGVLLDVDTKYIHGGGDTDAGSGYKKVLSIFKKDYAYSSSSGHKDRTYVADLIKNTLNMSDEKYLEFVKANANKPISEIKPEECQKKLVETFATINSNTRIGDRAYNEMYVTNPSVMGVFAYSTNDCVGNTMDFIASQKDFLKQYALDNDIPFVVFGN